MVIKMANPMVNMYISTLTPNSAIKLAKKYGVDLTYDEASKIVPFLKRNKNNLNKENKNRLLNEGRNLVKPQTYSKIVTLIDRFI